MAKFSLSAKQMIGMGANDRSVGLHLRGQGAVFRAS